jgi:HSP20 family protein
MRLTRYRTISPDLAAWKRAGEMPPRLTRLFDEFFSPPLPETMTWSPAVDIVDSEGELLLTAELPGMAKEDVQIQVQEGVLTLKGEKKEEKEEKGAEYRVWERSFGAFERTFTLPRSIDADRIAAEFENGVLLVHMPKMERAQGKRVEIAAK